MRSQSLFATALLVSLAGCVTVPNTKSCSVAGVLAAGMICAESNTGVTSEMTLDETIDFLEPQPERPDPARPGKMLPARAGAICQSSDDFNRVKTALEKACRKLGKRCTYEMRKTLKRAI